MQDKSLYFYKKRKVFGVKMKIVGVVSEFNPFHKGHEYLLSRLREGGAELVICVMSGDFVQRGEPAFADKYTRGAMAIECGADIVLELPYPYSAAGAEYFASAAVKILSEAGVNTLGFGSECGDIEALKNAAERVADKKFSEEYKRLCREGSGGAAAYFNAYKELYGEECPGGSNDILGIEYIKAAKSLGEDISFETVTRKGAAYTSCELPENAFASASALRGRMLDDRTLDACRDYIPEAAIKHLEVAAKEGMAFADIRNIERAILAALRLSTPETRTDIAEMTDGLGSRLAKFALEVTSIDELVSFVSAKNYTDTRIRRAMLFYMTGVKKSDLKAAPTYSTLLAANRRGLDYLSKKRRDLTIPIISKPADGKKLGRQFELSARADALWTLALPNPNSADILVKKSPIIFK